MISIDKMEIEVNKRYGLIARAFEVAFKEAGFNHSIEFVDENSSYLNFDIVFDDKGKQ